MSAKSYWNRCSQFLFNFFYKKGKKRLTVTEDIQRTLKFSPFNQLCHVYFRESYRELNNRGYKLDLD